MMMINILWAICNTERIMIVCKTEDRVIMEWRKVDLWDS